MGFRLVSEFEPSGDQPEAIRQLVEGVRRGDRFQTLLGVTGSGKTHTMARTIEQLERPALIISHNKTLAAQLYGEFRSFFPENSWWRPRSKSDRWCTPSISWKPRVPPKSNWMSNAARA